MNFISRHLDRVQDFLALEVDHVARFVLGVLSQRQDYYVRHGISFTEFVDLQRHVQGGGLYGGDSAPHWNEVTRALGEGWNWLNAQGFLAPHRRGGGKCVLTRRALEVSTPEAFDHYRKASLVPWELIHPTLVSFAEADVLAGRFERAITECFKQVEIAVRDAGGYPQSLVGAELMNEAFRPEDQVKDTRPIGRLTDVELNPSEQKGMRDLFVGANGNIRNAYAHKFVGLSEITEGIEIIMFASHLLRIVDRRRAALEATDLVEPS